MQGGYSSGSDGEFDDEGDGYGWRPDDEEEPQPAAAGPTLAVEPVVSGEGLTEIDGWTNRGAGPFIAPRRTDGTVAGGRRPGAAHIALCAPRCSLTLIARVRSGLGELCVGRLVKVEGYDGAQGHVLSLGERNDTVRVQLWSGDLKLYAAVWTRRGLSPAPCRVSCLMAGSRSRSRGPTAHRCR